MLLLRVFIKHTFYSLNKYLVGNYYVLGTLSSTVIIQWANQKESGFYGEMDNKQINKYKVSLGNFKQSAYLNSGKYLFCFLSRSIYLQLPTVLNSS